MKLIKICSVCLEFGEFEVCPECKCKDVRLCRARESRHEFGEWRVVFEESKP